VQELARRVMGYFLFIEESLDCRKEHIKLFRLDDRPGNNVELSSVKPRNEVRVLFVLDDFLVTEISFPEKANETFLT
jgi:hypothetical protein